MTCVNARTKSRDMYGSCHCPAPQGLGVCAATEDGSMSATGGSRSTEVPAASCFYTMWVHATACLLGFSLLPVLRLVPAAHLSSFEEMSITGVVSPILLSERPHGGHLKPWLYVIYFSEQLKVTKVVGIIPLKEHNNSLQTMKKTILIKCHIENLKE